MPGSAPPSPPPSQAPDLPAGVAAPTQAPPPNLGHPANEAPYWQDCDGVVTIVWFKVPTPGSPGQAKAGATGKPAVVTLYPLAAKVVAAPISVGFDPAGFGITGMASYFWITGYDGQPIFGTVQGVDPATGLAASIQIRATLRSFTWSFGDGTSLTTTSLGSPYPAISDIAHTYDVRSDRSPLAVNGVYQVSVQAVFDVAYQVSVPGAGLNPTGWTNFADSGLAPLTSTAEHDHKVVEVRSVLTS